MRLSTIKLGPLTPAIAAHIPRLTCRWVSYLGHFANDARACASPDEVDAYRRESTEAANCEPVLLEGCHFALQALRPIDEGEELLFSYGEGYWLARNGHEGVGTDLRCIGTAPPSRAQQESELLKQALQQRSRPQKSPKRTAAGGKSKKAKKTKKPVARGFGSRGED